MRRLILPLLSLAASLAAQPLRLLPDNPHYFEFRGKPAILVTSGEHYGAVLNLDFDYRRYLAALAKDRLNLTRIFTGVYSEVPGSFGIANNTLAPKPGRSIAPWARSGEGGKFDLSRWDEAYFARLKDFVREADRRGVVVEVVLFCPYYQEGMWEASPLHIRNNINGIGDVKRSAVLTLENAGLVDAQEAMVRKIVGELRGFDNLYYEVCNEPYTRDVPLAWQRHIARVIASAESSPGPRHLIAQNYSNGSKKIEDPDPVVSLFNFHYSRPPGSVALNYGLNKAIGNNETGGDGTADAAYRIQGWEFILAGGALYNTLDYSFTVGQEDGTFVYPEKQPGGGSAALRKQLGILRDFIHGFDFARMAPAPEIVRAAPAEGSVRTLAEPGRAYAVYVHHGAVVPKGKPRYQVDGRSRQVTLTMDLPAGSYRAAWVDTRSGNAIAPQSFRHGGGARSFASPPYREDTALRVLRR